ncbi:MAG: aldo/keto reductase, partial [Proteobacteria bacterium]|nr:aldo/keto reductase [Pseudomonadota bacterium]
RLGKTGMMVSKLGFGGIPIQRLSEERAVEVVRRCLDLGVTFIDTANAYSTSEERIGKAIAGRRDSVVLATKSLSRTREGVEKHLELSLERLGVDSIDLFQFHQIFDSETLETILDPEGPMAVLEKAKGKGRIKHIGITSHSLDTAKEAVKTGRFETVQFPFNFITSEPADELLPLCREHDVGFIVMKPLGGGMLGNAAVAFKYLLQFPDIVMIPGIERESEIEEIVSIFQNPTEMDDAEVREMQRLREELGTRFCRRCGYCQPCTTDIAISTVMIADSFGKRLPPERFFSEQMAATILKAAECDDCGECEERCPYELPIREVIAERVEWYREEREDYFKASGDRESG